MPNHFHAILEIVLAILAVASWFRGCLESKRGQLQGIAPTIAPTIALPTKRKTLGDILGAFESITTVKYIRGVKTKNWKPFNKKLWQRDYWEEIRNNSKKWNDESLK